MNVKELFRKYKLGIIAIVVLLVVAVPLTIFQLNKQQENRSRAAGEQISMVLTPNPGTGTVGQPLNVQVSINAATNQITAADITFTYDSSILTFTSFTPAAPFQDTTPPGSGGLGTFRFAGLVPASATTPTGSVPLGTIVFTGKAAGTASVGFSNVRVNDKSTLTALPLGTAQPGSYTITSTSAVGESCKFTITPAPGMISPTNGQCPPTAPLCNVYQNSSTTWAGGCVAQHTLPIDLAQPGPSEHCAHRNDVCRAEMPTCLDLGLFKDTANGNTVYDPGGICGAGTPIFNTPTPPGGTCSQHNVSTLEGILACTDAGCKVCPQGCVSMNTSCIFPPTPTTAPTATLTPTPAPTTPPGVTPTNTPTPTSVPTPTNTPAPTVPAPTVALGHSAIKLSFTIPGMGKSTNPNIILNNNPKHPTRNLEVKVFNSQNQVVLAPTTNAQFNSTASTFDATVDLGSNFTSGSYLVKARMDNTLWKQIPGIIAITSGSTVAAPITELIPGDINQDNQMTIQDYNSFVTCFGKTTCTNFDKANLNDDDVIDDLDLNLMIAAFLTRNGD